MLPAPHNEFPKLRPEGEGEVNAAVRHRPFQLLSDLPWLRRTTKVRKRNRSALS